MAHESVETLVIGAGISGLSYAHARGPEADLLVLEASEEAGGFMRTEQRGPYRYEWGPESIATGTPAVGELLSELGLPESPAPAAAKRRFIAQGGKLQALPAGPKGLLGTPLLSWRGKLRLLSEPWRDPSIGLSGSVAKFARHRLGQEVLDEFLDPFVAGIYAGDPEDLSLRAAFPRLAKMVDDHGSLFRGLRKGTGHKPSILSFEAGNGTVTGALAEHLGDRLRLATPVSKLTRGLGTWKVTTDGVTIECRRLVIATGARSAAVLLDGHSQVLSADLRSIPHESLASVHHAWEREQVAHALDGFGYLVPKKREAHHLGTLFSSSLRPGVAPEGQVLLRTFVGGAREPRALELEDTALVERTVGDMRPWLGLEGRPVEAWVHRHGAAIPRYDLEHPDRMLRFERAVRDQPGLSLLGIYLRGIGVPLRIERARDLARSHRG